MTEARRSLSLLSAILEIHRTSAVEANLEKIAGIAVREIVRNLPCERSAVFLIDEKENCVLATVGIEDETVTGVFGTDMPAMRYLRQTGQAVFSGDVRNSPVREYALPGSDASSVVWAPVRISGDIGGLLYADSCLRNAFDRDELLIVEVLAEEISIFLQISFMRSRILEVTVRDALTGCLNRKKFEEDLDLELACAERYDRVFSVVLMAIDGLGLHKHVIGDSLLKQVGEILSLSIRVCDRLYRYGGQEFALILPGIDRERAVFAARRLQAVISKRRFGEGRDEGRGLDIMLSAGVASFPADSVHKHGLIKYAAGALREAGDSGKGPVA